MEGLIKAVIVEAFEGLVSRMLGRIYIEEQYWDRLLDLLKQNLSLASIDQYLDYLIKDYKEELLDLYCKAIIQFLEKKAGRKYYKRACKYILKIQKMGAGKRIKKLVNQLKERHPTRKALLEELDKANLLLSFGA